MAAIFIEPKFEKKSNPAGVYKITLDESYFYIGGSTMLRSRFGQWKTRLKAGVNKNLRMRELFKTTSEVKFEIIELTPDGADPRDREDFYIKQNWDNPLFLNKCPNAHNNLGVKFVRTATQKQRGKPIAMFDLNWNFIEKFDFIADAKEKIGISRRNGINDFLQGKCQYIKGYKFKLIAPDGSYIEPKPFVSKRPPLKPKKIKQEPTAPTAIIQYDLVGNEIDRHESLRAAARAIGIDRSNFRWQIKNSKTGYCRGYIFKYA